MAVVYRWMGQTSTVCVCVLYPKLEGGFNCFDGAHIANCCIPILGFDIAERTPNLRLSLVLQFHCICVDWCLCSIICETVVCDDCCCIDSLCLVVVASIAFVQSQGYSVVGYHHCSVLSHCPSLVCFVGHGTDPDGGGQNDQYGSSTVVFPHSFDVCIDFYTQSFDW